MTLAVGLGGIAVENIAAIARDGLRIELAPEILERLCVARQVLDRAAASGQKIYGLNTGLGANLKTPVEGDVVLFQRQLIHGRSGSVGEPMQREWVRATMAARISMLAAGGSGVSPHIVEALAAALNAGIHPVMPRIGSIGAGDLLLLAPVARMLTGEGEVEWKDTRLPASEALICAGLAPVDLGPKDGLSLINASAASVGHGALTVLDALAAYRQQQQAAALTFEALGANPTILDPRLQTARPAFGQALAAAELRKLLEKSGVRPTTTIQDPLSLRCIPSIHGALGDAIDRARAALEIELQGAADNPLVLPDDGLVLSTGNFHTAALALAFETLGLAIAQAAAATVARFIQLTGPQRHGLPKYLSPTGGVSAGFVPLQKTVTAILAAIRHKANPVMLDFLPVSEGVEDHATQTPLAVAKCAEMIELWRQLVAFELMAAAQAVDLRQDAPLAPATRRIHASVRDHVTPLREDRPLGADAEALYAALSSGKWHA